MKRARLVNLSICECGFPLLDESIPLGTEYEIDPEKRINLWFICGGCRKRFPVSAVWVGPRGSSRPGYLPAAAFELIPDPGKQQ